MCFLKYDWININFTWQEKFVYVETLQNYLKAWTQTNSLFLQRMCPEKNRGEERRRRRKRRNSREFSIILILFYAYSNFGILAYLFFPLCYTLIHLSVSLDLCLSVSHFSHNCVWTRGSFSIGLAATGGQRRRDRESKQWGGLADAPCYFSSASHWLCQQWLSLSRASELRGALTTCPLQLSEGTYQRHT